MLRTPVPLLEMGRSITMTVCCTCKHFICIDFNGVAVLHELSFVWLFFLVKASPPILEKNNNVMGNAGMHRALWQSYKYK